MLHWLLQIVRNAQGKVSPVRVILAGFAAIVLLGTALLALPAASADGNSIGLLSALFTATSATCVTGLAVVETGLYWSGFGKIVILCLIQIGGLGFMTVFSVVFMMLGKRVGLKGRMVIAQSMSLNDYKDAAAIARHAVYWTFSMEGVGAVCLTLGFLRKFGFWQAVRYGVFHSISAFCNAGFDILGDVEAGGSLAAYATDPIICIPLMLLIVFGGLGFFVWDDLVRSRSWRKLSVYSKLVILVNAALLLGGGILFFIFEYGNPGTIREFSVGNKILAAMFQSVTVRTAGFAAVSQGSLTGASMALSTFLMLIGGSSGSTAGGIKTVTFAITVLSAWSVSVGRPNLTVFRKTISREQTSQATCIVLLMVLLSLAGTIFLTACNHIEASAAAFEVVSALATVGLSTGITPVLSVASKLLLIVFMFFGRVGVLTISFAFLTGDRAVERYRYAEEKMMIG